MHKEKTIQQFNWKKPLLIGCGTLSLLVVLFFTWVFIWLFTGPTSGVKVGNEIDDYALEYIRDNNLLNETERLIAYYDVTMEMDGSEAAILTTERVMYHRNKTTHAANLREVIEITHRYDSFVGDVIEVTTDSGEYMKIEIAPLNLGKTFYNILYKQWMRVRDTNS